MKTAKCRITQIMPHDRPEKGCYVVAEFLLTSASRSPSAIAELLVVQRETIKSCQKDDKSPLKWAWFCSRDLFFVCTAVELEKNLHCTR